MAHTQSAERDYPVGHPAAADYKGEPYSPPKAPFAEDFPEGHQARSGANVGALDTPDGFRAAHNAHAADLQELAMIGALPPLRDPDTGEVLELAPEALALVYRVRQCLRDAAAEVVTHRYGLTEPLKRKAEENAPAVTEEQQALAHIVSLGYTPERAREILERYGVPDVMREREADAHR